MKSIKWLGFCLLGLLATMGLTSCGEDEYHSRLRELIIKDLSFEANDEGGKPLSHTTTFRNEDLSNYQATADKQWCKVVINDSLSQMIVTVNENEEYDERKATVTIVDVKDPAVTRTFTVSQKQHDAVLLSSKGSYDVGTNGETLTLIVDHNVSDYEVTTNVDWIHLSVSRTRGLTSTQVQVTVDKNLTGVERRGIITVYSDLTGDDHTCIINQKFTESFSIDTWEYNIDEYGGTIAIECKTNLKQFDVYLSTGDTWVRNAGREEHLEDGYVYQFITVAPYTEKGAGRSTTVYLQDYTITIGQYRDVYVDETNITMITQETTALTLHNLSGPGVVWSSSDEKVATVDENGVVTAIGVGTAVITVSSANGRHTDTATVVVEKPKDLKDQLAYDWQVAKETVGDTASVVSSLACTLTNQSNYTITIGRATLYRDTKEVSSVNYNDQSGKVAPGEIKKATFDNLIHFIETESGRVLDTDEHNYMVVWEYGYNGESFRYRCDEVLKSRSSARKRR